LIWPNVVTNDFPMWSFPILVYVSVNRSELLDSRAFRACEHMTKYMSDDQVEKMRVVAGHPSSSKEGGRVKKRVHRSDVLCHLTHAPCTRVATASDGYSYDKNALSALFEESAIPYSPVTGERLFRFFTHGNYALENQP
jgi:hypothetical protein